MKKLDVYIEINGKRQHTGTISGEDYRDASFSYSDSYLGIPGIKPISQSLPLSEGSFAPELTKNYFEGLLPEGFSRKAVANHIKAYEEDYLTILEVLGRECLGAVSIGDENTDIKSAYDPLSEKKVKALAAEGVTRSTKLLLKTHLSLTGATGKVGLYYDVKNDKWYMPKGRYASTHIVKQSHVRLKDIVLNEYLCIKTAEKLGIDVPECFILNTGKGKEEDILLATKRFDRVLSDEVSENGMSIPYRLHQEDFAQALGISSGSKYETDKRGYVNKIFDLVNRVCTDPVADKMKLWDKLVFDYLVGDNDGHIKNISLLYDRDLKNIKLAPAYDILCTEIYDTSGEMSIFIGENNLLKNIKRKDFEAAADEAGIGKKIALKHFDDLANGFEAAIKEAVYMAKENGFKNAGKLSEKFVRAGGYANAP